MRCIIISVITLLLYVSANSTATVYQSVRSCSKNLFQLMVPPVIQLQSPVLQDTVYYTGPYEINATVTDPDGIGYVRIVYNIYGGPADTIDMVATTGNLYQGFIPGHLYNTNISYSIIASDILNYTTQSPTYTFYIRKYPYIDMQVGTSLSTSNGAGPISISSASPMQWHLNHISIYTKEEVGYAGKMVKLQWYKGNSEGCTTNNATFKIYLKETNATTISSAAGTFTAELAGATLVYESTTQNVPLVTGWTAFEFNVDTFNYSGNSNLMVMTLWFPPQAATGTVVWQYTTETGKSQSWTGSNNPPTLTSGTNLRPNILMTFLKPNYPTDAGVESLLSPTLSVAPPTLQPVTVEIRNHGVDPLLKTDIGWSLNGQAQPTYNWTGSLGEDMLSGPITIDSVTLPFGVNRIRVWTGQPNDTTDMDPGNDTLAALICPGALTGTYTIGSGGTFASIESAIEALTECGIAGSVVFNLLPGTYTGQWTIPSITGVSATKTITFRSATSDPADVTLIRDTTALLNFTWNFNDAMYISMKHLSLKSTDPANGNVVVFSGNSRFIIIDSCIIEAPLGTTATSAPIYSNNCPGYHNTISNSLLTGGYYGVFYIGQSSYRKTLLTLTNNQIIDFWNYGFVSSYADSMMITGNTFRNRQGGADFFGISLQQTSGHSLITRNRIIYDGISNSYGIHIQSNQSVASSYILVSNNFISLKCNTGKTTYGLNPWAATTLNFYNNSIHLYGTGSATSRCVMLSNGSSLNFTNNIYSNTAGGYAFYTSSASYVSTSNNNNFYTNSTNFIQWGSTSVATLSAYKTLSGKDAASHSIMPPFVSDYDLSLTNRTLSGRGAVLSMVPDDFFGSARTPYPTIGAHEMPLLPYDAGVTVINTPTPQSVIYQGNTVPVTVQLTNFGFTTITGLDVLYRVNNGSPVAATFSGNIPMFQSALMNLPPFISPLDTTLLCVYTVLQGDTAFENDTCCITYYGRSVTDAALKRIITPQGGCGLMQQNISVMVSNPGIAPINTPFSVSFNIEGDTTVFTQQVSNITIPVSDSALVVFNTPVNLSVASDSVFKFRAWVDVTGDLNKLNDTAQSEARITPDALPPAISDTTILYGTQMTFSLQTNDSIFWYDSDTAQTWIARGKVFTTPYLFDTTTYWAEAVPGPFFSSSPFIFTEICQFKSTIGQPVNGWPAWLIAGNYVEISGIPGSDLGGTTLEQWTTSLISSHTFPPGTLISPWGTAIIATGGLSSSIPSPAHYYYHGNGNYSGGFLSTLSSGRILRDTNGAIIDAVGYRGYTFLPASGVTSQHWSGTTPGMNAGIRLEGMYTRTSANWVQSSAATPQDPNVFHESISFPGDQICPSGRFSATINIYGTPPYDIGISEINTRSGCALLMEPVSIKVFNRGIDTLKGGALATFRINNDPWQPSETIPDTIAPGDTITYTFNTLANMTAPQTHDTAFVISAVVKAPLDIFPLNDSIVSDSIVSLRSSPMPIVTLQSQTIPYGASAVLQAICPFPVEWYTDDTTTIPISIGKTFITPPLTDTTIYWAGSIASTIPLAQLQGTSQHSVYTYAHTRGFYFQAPVNMVITELMAPTTLPAGPQFIQVVKFPSHPATFPDGGPHVDLGYFANIPFGTPISTEIYIQAGEFIGLLGGTAQLSSTGAQTGQMHTSYNNNQYAYVHLGGSSTTQITRIGYQNSINTGPAPTGTIHRLGGSNLGRIEMKWIIPGPGCASARVPVSVNTQAQPGCDISADHITWPSTAVNLGVAEQVTVRLVNLGTTPQSNFQVGYRVDNLPPVHEIFTGSLPANDTVEYTFLTPANFGIPGSLYRISAWATCSCDQNLLNDTSHTIVKHIAGYCASSATDTANQDITEVTLHTLSNQSAPSGMVYSDFTTSVTPVVLNPGQSYPMSVTSSFVQPNAAQKNCYIKAWIDFNRDGIFDPVDELILSQAIQSNQTISSVINVPGDAKYGNTVMRVVLNQTATHSNVQPCGTYQYGETEDYPITILPVMQKDVAIVSIIEPADIVTSGIPYPVKFIVMNTGTNIINPGELLASYTLNGGNPLYSYIMHAIPPGDIDTVQLPDLIPSPGANVLHCYLDLMGDSLIFNNQKAKYFFGELHATLPFYDDFEGINCWYTTNNNTLWRFGQPSGSIINSAYSGTKTWHTLLDGTAPNTTDFLYSPVFDFSALSISQVVQLSFSHLLKNISLSEQFQVHYSLDNGQTWILLGNSVSPNWYDAQSSGNYFFSNSTITWVTKSINLPSSLFNGNPTVRFRFYAKTTGITSFNGWAIDDFRLSLDPVANDVGLFKVSLPANDTLPGSILYPTIGIVNYGTLSQPSIPVSYSLDGTTIATETWTGTLYHSDTTLYTFSTPFTVPSQHYQICATTQLATDLATFNDEKCSYFNISQLVNDLSVTQILQPTTDSTGQLCYYEGQSQPWYAYDVSVRIENFGLLSQTGFPIRYSFDGGNTVMTEIWPGTIEKNGYSDILLSAKFLPVLGQQQMCVGTDLPGDMVPSNNETCKQYTGVGCIGINEHETDLFSMGQNTPNPARDFTTVDFFVPSNGEAVFRFLNISGVVIHSESHSVEKGLHRIPLNVSNLPSGIYLYTLEFKGQRLFRKMVVNNGR